MLPGSYRLKTSKERYIDMSAEIGATLIHMIFKRTTGLSKKVGSYLLIEPPMGQSFI